MGNRAFDLHSAYMSQAWRTLKDSIILKLDRLERRVAPHSSIGTPNQARTHHIYCPDHPWASVDNNHVWQHMNKDWHCVECDGMMRQKPWTTPRDKWMYNRDGKRENSTDRHLRIAQIKLNQHRWRQQEQEDMQSNTPDSPPPVNQVGDWGIPGPDGDPQTRFRLNGEGQ